MTQETLQRANQLNNTISDLDTQIRLVEDMHHCDNYLTLAVNTIGTITIAGDDELKDDIIDTILHRLNNKKEELEDELRLL
jgi:hypothetical protein